MSKLNLGTATLSKNLVIATIACISLSILISLRLFGPGLDTEIYISIFDSIAASGPDISSRYEPLFQMLIWILTKLSHNGIAIFFGAILISLYLKAYAVKESKGSLLIFLPLYMALWAATLENNQIRAAIAISILYLAITRIERQPLTAVILGFLAIGFHYSMILVVSIISIIEIINIFKRSKTTALALISGIALISTILYEIAAEEIVPRAILMTGTLDISQVSLLSPYAVINYSFFFALLFARRRYKIAAPYFHPHITATVAIGICLFIILGWNNLPYSYRILETTTATAPLLLAVIWSTTKSRAIKIHIAIVTMLAIVYSPHYWAINSSL